MANEDDGFPLTGLPRHAERRDTRSCAHLTRAETEQQVLALMSGQGA